MIFVKTPFRLSFLGGGTDHPVWFKKNEGIVISTAINKYCYVIGDKNNIFNPEYCFFLQYQITEKTNLIKNIKHRVIREAISRFYNHNPKKLLKIIHTSDLPSKSGIGSSSSFSVSILNLLQSLEKRKFSKNFLLKKTLEFEYKSLKEFVGYQDQIAAVHGGFNIINFKNDRFSINNIKNYKVLSEYLKKKSLLIHSGIFRSAEDIEREKFGNKKIKYNLLKSIYEIASEGKKALNKSTKNFIVELPRLILESWKIKKNLSKKVSNSKIDNIFDYCFSRGAISGKVLGAGGGGFILFLFNNQIERDKIAKYFRSKKLLVVDDLEIDNNGTVLNHD